MVIIIITIMIIIITLIIIKITIITIESHLFCLNSILGRLIVLTILLLKFILAYFWIIEINFHCESTKAKIA